jgi:uncharacterized protein YcfL
MKTSFALATVLAALLAVGCAAETADSANDPNATSSDEADLKVHGHTLKNGADLSINNGPDTVRVTATAKGVKATVTDSSLATCDVKVNASASSNSKTVFDIAIDYQLDDGFNGCTIAFKGDGYSSTLTVGLDIND